MLWIFRFFTGFLLVEFSGDYSERILNLCAQNRISLWQLRCSKHKITGYITIKSFKALRHVKKGSKIKVRILKKYGFPFFIARYNKRAGFLLGAVMFFVMLNFLSQFIWTINISGNTKVESSEILNACNKIGIYESVKKSEIDTYIQKEKLLLNIDSLAWASLNIEGSILNINVTEIQNKTSQEDFQPTNLKASADGIIKKIDVTSGNCIVKVGEAVKKGDILVSGIVERLSSTEFVHSQGTITAETERTINSNLSYTQCIKTQTGQKIEKNVFNFFGLNIPLYLGTTKAEYEEKITVKRAELFGKKLPIKLTTKRFYPITSNNVTFTHDEVTAQLKEDTERQIKAFGITDYALKSQTVTENEVGLSMETIILATENIVYQDILLISSGN